MDELLKACAQIHDQSLQPFGIVGVRANVSGEPTGFIYEYVNPAMAAMTGNAVEDLLGRDMFELWPTYENDPTLRNFAQAALEGIPSEFEAPSPVLSDFFHASVFPIEGHRGFCGFLVQNVTAWVDRVNASLATAQEDMEGNGPLCDVLSRLSALQEQKDELQSALDLAEEGSRAKDTFLANVSHDFRTPMNAISGFAGIALDNLDDRDTVRDGLEKIQLSSNHLLDLVNEILDASRIQSGKLSITSEPLSLTATIRKIVTMFSDQAETRGLAFTVQEEGIRHDAIIADKLRITQVLMNVIGNAFKFTPDDGAVTLTVVEGEQPATNQGLYIFTVSDTGCGMAEDFLQRVFDPFERSSSSLVSQTEGTGLGMAITKNLVDLMGGTISVQSELGVGTTFTIRLPLELDEGTKVAGEGRPSSRKKANTDLVDLAGKRALVADDDDLSREVLTVTLGRHGFLVDAFSDGDEAVRAMQASSQGFYDVLLLDMHMPNLNGDDAARTIRALDRADAKQVPILAVTADAFDEALEKARAAGMTDRVTKPLDVPLLLDTLSACL